MQKDFYKQAKEMLKRDEGKRNKAYLCPRGFWTVGVGHNLEAKPISDLAVEQILSDDLSDAIKDCSDIFKGYWNGFPFEVKLALVNMCFQLGKAGLAGFIKMRGHLLEGQYREAARESLDSDWAKQTPERAKRVAELMSNERIPNGRTG